MRVVYHPGRHGFVQRACQWLTLEKTAAILTIFGIAFAVWQYLAIEQDGRVTATLSYVTRFSSPPVSDSFRHIYAAWQEKEGVDLLHSQDQTDLVAKKIKYIHDHNLDWDAVVVGDYFDQLYICVREKICDLPLAITMLGRDIETTYVYSGRYLDKMRKTMGGNTGCGLSALYSLAASRLAYDRSASEQSGLHKPPKMKVSQHACPPV